MFTPLVGSMRVEYLKVERHVLASLDMFVQVEAIAALDV